MLKLLNTSVIVSILISISISIFAGGNNVSIDILTLSTLLLFVSFLTNKDVSIIAFYIYFFISFIVTRLTPIAMYGHGAWLTIGKDILLSTTALAIFLPKFRKLTPLILLGSLFTYIATILSSPKPKIDVWYEYQVASKGLLNGHNPYLIHWSSHIHLPFEVSNVFTYLPFSSLFLDPFYFLFGDVRYGLVFALLVASFFAYKLCGKYGYLVASAILLFPRGSYAIEQSWNDPILLASLLGAVYFFTKKKYWLAIIFFGLALSTVQYAFLFVPLAFFYFGKRILYSLGIVSLVCLPFFLDAPKAFIKGVLYNLHIPARSDSWSLYLLFRPEFVATIIAVVAVVTAIIFVLRFHKHNFIFSCGLIFIVYDLFNKASFFNEWEFGALLILVGGCYLVEDYKDNSMLSRSIIVESPETIRLS